MGTYWVPYRRDFNLWHCEARHRGILAAQRVLRRSSRHVRNGKTKGEPWWKTHILLLVFPRGSFHFWSSITIYILIRYIYISTYFSLLLYHDDRIQLQPFVKAMGQVMVPLQKGMVCSWTLTSSSVVHRVKKTWSMPKSSDLWLLNVG